MKPNSLASVIENLQTQIRWAESKKDTAISDLASLDENISVAKIQMRELKDSITRLKKASVISLTDWANISFELEFLDSHLTNIKNKHTAAAEALKKLQTDLKIANKRLAHFKDLRDNNGKILPMVTK